MKTVFHIDRQFGVTIFIDVEDGIVVECKNDGKLTDIMTEKYKGKSITFLKEDFEAKMKGTYHNVRSEDWVTAKQIERAIESRIDNCWTIINGDNNSEEKNKGLKIAIANYEKELAEAKRNTKKVIEDLEKYHNFIVKTK